MENVKKEREIEEDLKKKNTKSKRVKQIEESRECEEVT